MFAVACISYSSLMESSNSDSFLYSKFRIFSTDDIDNKRHKSIAYEYLCHLEEARLWIQICIKEDLPALTEFEERLRNGVYLARLGHYIAPHTVPLRKIFDNDQRIYDVSGLHYRHTDNINYWLSAMKTIGLPSYFYPNSFDVYNKKNMPKAIYCIHALNLYLFRYSEGSKIMDLLGKIHFSSAEINSVQTEFNKLGIKLPAFGKIGDILSSKITANDSALHAAVISINIAINSQSNQNLLPALMNPNAKLNNVMPKYCEYYLNSLRESKLKKFSGIECKEINLYNIPEMYITFLSHKSIQKVIDTVNFLKLLSELNEAVLLNDSAYFESTLRQEFLGILDIISDNCNMYMKEFKEIYNKNYIDDPKKLNLQNIVSIVNNMVSESREINQILLEINYAIENDDSALLLNLLHSKILMIKPIYDFGILFYHSQLRNIKLKRKQLSLEELKNNMQILSALIEVSMAIFKKDPEDIYKVLSNPLLQLMDLNPLYKNHYCHFILGLIEMQHSEPKILTFEQIKKCIFEVNYNLKEKDEKMHLLKHINSAVSSKCAKSLLCALHQANILTSIQSKNKELYLEFLFQSKNTKENLTMLSCEEIQEQINAANKLAFDTENYCIALAAIDTAIDSKDSRRLLKTLQTFFKDTQICENCEEVYLKHLLDFKMEELNKYEVENSLTSWIKHTVSSSLVFYLNTQTLEMEWNKKEIPDCFLIDYDGILAKILKVGCKCRNIRDQFLDTFITSLQACIRGFLFRHSICIQNGKKNFHHFDKEQAACKIQSFIRMSLVRKKYLEEKAEKMKLDRAARLIQRLWQSFKIKQNLKLLTHSANPPLSLIQKIINMLEISNDDYSDELKLNNIKGKIVQTIRRNEELVKEIDDMDIKIGLLIRNRLSLQDLINQKGKASFKKTMRLNECINDQNCCKNLYLFNQKNNALVKAYENLLYLLQTKFAYLARLIVSLPSNQAFEFIESVIFSLYNYGSTPRDEYLLLNLLCMALEEEIKCKVDKINDIITGDHLILKIIISFYRKGQRRDCLRELLQPLILKALADECSGHSTNPIEIYKLWQNEIEIESGKRSLLPYEVTLKDALGYEEVNHRLNLFLDNLLKHSLSFCKAIVNCQKLIPFGLKHAAKVLKTALQRKYPHACLKELYKIVGNFLYYRFINPAIVAPDSFEIIDLCHNEQLDDNSRLKLSFIGNFLQFAATGKTYTEESSHLMCLNPYLNDCHEKFMLFFEDICKVEEPEEYFKISAFYEAIIPEPTVYLTIQELSKLHKLVIQKAYDLAPDPNDILHEILDDFSSLSTDDIFKERNHQMELCFSLRSKHAVEFEDETEEEKTYVETKFMLITLLQVFCCQASISELLTKQPSFEEEEKFEKICFMKRNDSDISRCWIRKFRDWTTLSSFITVLQYNLNLLELAGYVSSKNDYQDILNDIAKDIINRWKYQINRKEDILKAQEVQKQLDLKTIHYLEKLDFYNKYIETCLENLESGKKRIHKKIFSHHQETNNEVKNMKTLKYSGSKLYEKGILLEIKDLDIHQYKNVLFEVRSSQDAGIFVFEAKFMGIPLNCIHIDIQDLLAMKYQGTAVLNIFDCIKINSNLLLHFLNCKFYGKL